MNKYIVRMAAGLANRMFQYTFFLYLKNNGYDAYVDNGYKATKWKMEDIDWERIFPNAQISKASKWQIFKYGGGYNLIDKVRRHYLPFTTKCWISEDPTLVPTREDLDCYNYFIGVMQDSAIAEYVKQEVFAAFSFSAFETGSDNDLLARKLMSENSVSIHVRKGRDYMQHEKFKNTCPVTYYQKAIDIIKDRVDNPRFYVFTDNPDWVKEQFVDFDYTLVTGNSAIGWGNHFDMQLMSCCKHNIIANSTYSWWGAFLNRNPNKIVINPKNWFNIEIPKYRDLKNKTLCKDWIML